MTLILILFILLAVVLWWVVVILDKERVRQHIVANRGTSPAIRWRPRKHGWTSDPLSYCDGNRIYEVQYIDLNGNSCHAWCKTSLLGGVGFESDEFVRSGTMSS